MNDSDYPGLFALADNASRTAQTRYLTSNKIYMASLLIASAIGAVVTVVPESWDDTLSIAVSVLLIGGFVLLWFMKGQKDERVWFDGRAVAESVKTTAWKFMTQTPPYDQQNGVEERFVANLGEIRTARPELGKYMAVSMMAGTDSITNEMRRVRTLAFQERKGVYLTERLRDQRVWYSAKARFNAKWGKYCFRGIVSIQALAIGLGLLAAAYGTLATVGIPICATIAATIAAWHQLTRHDELAQSYALAAQELDDLASLGEQILVESEFHQFVEQVEDSISREHTMWCARRDVRLG